MSEKLVKHDPMLHFEYAPAPDYGDLEYNKAWACTGKTSGDPNWRCKGDCVLFTFGTGMPKKCPYMDTADDVFWREIINVQHIGHGEEMMPE